MAISPCDDYLPVTIFSPCPEVVIISDILCITESERQENAKHQLTCRSLCDVTLLSHLARSELN